MTARAWQPTEEQLWCRDVQHSWGPYTAEPDGRGFIRVLKCGNCGLKKEQILTKDGFIVRSRMLDYPVGYLRVGEGRLTKKDRAAIRVRNLS